jgi:hypothetical protein
MKKLLLFVAGTAALNANAQYARHHLSDAAVPQTKTRTQMSRAERDGYVPGTPRPAARTTTATCFHTETFAGGLTTGWTAGSFVPAAPGSPTWRWTNVALGGAYNIGTLASPTASDGWMGYNSDSIGDIGGGLGIKPSGWLQSPAINCSAHSTVRLNFYEKFRRFQDSMSVWVGTDPTWAAGTYHVYPVTKNNNTAVNTSLANPTQIHMNITGAAAGMSAVYLRFVHYCYQDGGGYNWLLDDVCLSELDPTDVTIAGSFGYASDAAYDYQSSLLYMTPLSMVDSVSPVTLLSNYGSTAAASTSLTAQIFRGSTSVYSQPETYSALSIDAVDSIVQWSTPYLPDATGSYVCAIAATTTGDADLTNNMDTVKFNVGDTTWMQGDPAGWTGSGYYLNRTGTSPISFMQGTRFDIPSGAQPDTVSGFGVVFSGPTSVPTGTGKVSVQLYKHPAGATGWTYVGTSISKSLTASDISASTAGIVWSDFREDPVASGGHLILEPGNNYAALVQINGVTTNLVVASNGGPNASGYCGYFGQSDSSTNTGLTEFAPTTNATGQTTIPMIRMYLGKPPRITVGVETVNAAAITVGGAYPNPANTSFTIPITTADDAVVTVSLTSVVGQELKTQVLNTVGGAAAKATFATSDLASGIYMYSVKVNGQTQTGRIVVSH